MENNKNLIIKKILYRSKYRGCKETDFLLGNFFEKEQQNIENFGLELCQDFLNEDDMMIYDWILDKNEFPSKYHQLILNIRKFSDIKIS
jgi:succinate dehydrogenase flavin-adding protein (antitoxin of CptAB toxin-antitoxin module)